jgi:hypothetical protein
VNANEFLIQLAAVETKCLEFGRTLKEGEYSPHRQALVELVLHFVEHSFANEDLNSVNDVLGRIDVLGRRPDIMIGLLRCSFRARNLLPNWWTARTRFHQELCRQGRDANHMLRGMMSHQPETNQDYTNEAKRPQVS